jgi:hypothetical protein
MAPVEFVPGTDLTVGRVIDFFGELHVVRAIEIEGGYLADAGLIPARRVAVDGEWRMTIPAGKVPCLPGTGASR